MYSCPALCKCSLLFFGVGVRIEVPGYEDMLRGWSGAFGHEALALWTSGWEGGGVDKLFVRCLGVQKEERWGYRHLNLFQEIVSGLGLSTQECDRITSRLVAKDYRAMFKRLRLNLAFAKDQGVKPEELKEVGGECGCVVIALLCSEKWFGNCAGHN